MPLDTWGTWPVTFRTGFVQVWSSDSYPGDELPLELPRSRGGNYQLPVATGTKNTGDQSLEETVDAYNEERGEAPPRPRTVRHRHLAHHALTPAPSA